MIEGQAITAASIAASIADEQEARAKAMRRYVLDWLQALPRDEALIICGAFLDEAGAGGVEFSHESVTQGEADIWADCAAPHELRAYFKAICAKLLVDTPLYGERTRKALLVDLWKTLPQADRARFLQSVDPSGEFVGKGRQ